MGEVTTTARSRPVVPEPRHATVQYPGGIRVDARWAGSGGGPAIFALSVSGGELSDLGSLAGEAYERLCRAELRVESPSGSWTVRLASPIFDEPAGVLWDGPGLLVIAYGFLTYGFVARTGELRWSHRSRSPIVAVLGSSRLDHVITQTEVETFALDEVGDLRWRVSHSDVVATASLTGGWLVLESYAGQRVALDPVTGRHDS